MCVWLLLVCDPWTKDERAISMPNVDMNVWFSKFPILKVKETDALLMQ